MYIFCLYAKTTYKRDTISSIQKMERNVKNAFRSRRRCQISTSTQHTITNRIRASYSIRTFQQNIYLQVNRFWTSRLSIFALFGFANNDNTRWKFICNEQVCYHGDAWERILCDTINKRVERATTINKKDANLLVRLFKTKKMRKTWQRLYSSVPRNDEIVSFRSFSCAVKLLCRILVHNDAPSQRNI